jgi:hypothetical protein
MVRAYCKPPYDPPLALDELPQLNKQGRLDKADEWNTNERPEEPTSVQDRVAADGTFRLMYTLKLLRGLVLGAALVVAQRAYGQLHARVVVGENQATPPRLESILFTALAMDAFAQMLVLLVLVLVSFAGKRGDNAFLIDDSFIQLFLTEYFTTTVSIIVLGVVYARVAQKKRYFALHTDGVSGSMAYRDILLGTSLVVNAIPFYLLLT